MNRRKLGLGLETTAERLEPAEAAKESAEVARSCNQALDDGRDPWAWPLSVERASGLLQPLEPERAARAARIFAMRIVSDPGNSCLAFAGTDELVASFDPDILERFLIGRSSPPIQRRSAAAAAAIGLPGQGPALILAVLPAAAEPLPCRLVAQDLVELLKMPTCVGPVRRVVLDRLGNRYGRRFDTPWDFVRYAEEQGLNLDFTTPPQRPDRKLPPLFEE